MAVYLNTAELDKKVALAGMTFGDFAKYCGVHPVTLSQARHGRAVRPITLHRIAFALARLPKANTALDGLLTTEAPETGGRKAG